ncbi:hypothetical protein [Piscinibacter gummiphilus]|uniref:Uncharacterized protein n=1 Tax=Piscinibacter gummiphilus TaxID=946333 RepID=A0ABZ0D0K9_9BURK|nr:hypothetical protein [Piscinibacter gummiphilus]WOB10718.1 hypothetical protein RXV79_11830 [Piscinibacter gummiphilus]
MSLDSKHTQDERQRAQAEEVFTDEGGAAASTAGARRPAASDVTLPQPALAAIRRFRRGRWTLMEDQR